MTNAAPGSELTKEPFRWDQRVFGIVLRMPATPPGDPMSTYVPSATDTALDAMCEVTGG
jgi:integrator complex subunit 6